VSCRKASTKSLRSSNIRAEVGHHNKLPSRGRNSSTSASETLKILVVEDNLVNQQVLAKQLRKAGCIVYLANHGGEAIEHVKESRFWKGREDDGLDIHVILMDLEMPVMDGTTAARKIREMQLAGNLVQHIPVIAVTANAREEQIKTTLEAGIVSFSCAPWFLKSMLTFFLQDDVMSKPFRIPELLTKIRGLMARYKVTIENRYW
jgi:CheY-like chemotaxis protein